MYFLICVEEVIIDRSIALYARRIAVYVKTIARLAQGARSANRLVSFRRWWSSAGTKRSRSEINLERTHVYEEIRTVRSIESEHKEEREPRENEASVLPRVEENG